MNRPYSYFGGASLHLCLEAHLAVAVDLSNRGDGARMGVAYVTQSKRQPESGMTDRGVPVSGFAVSWRPRSRASVP